MNNAKTIHFTKKVPTCVLYVMKCQFQYSKTPLLRTVIALSESGLNSVVSLIVNQNLHLAKYQLDTFIQSLKAILPQHILG